MEHLCEDCNQRRRPCKACMADMQRQPHRRPGKGAAGNPFDRKSKGSEKQMKDTKEEGTYYLISKKFIDSRIHQNETFLESIERSGKKEDVEIYLELLALLHDIQKSSHIVKGEEIGNIHIQNAGTINITM